MYDVLAIQAQNVLRDDSSEFLINDRLSFMRFLVLGLNDWVPDAKTIHLGRIGQQLRGDYAQASLGRNVEVESVWSPGPGSRDAVAFPPEARDGPSSVRYFIPGLRTDGATLSGERYRLFWCGNSGNREQFGVNEFLFDLAVCVVSTTRSFQIQARDLPFIARCHCQIESEFSRANTRDIVVDMSKLVMGSAENNLFVASRRGDREAAVLEQCSEIAACCTGRVYFCFVSHPGDWEVRAELPALHEWIAGGWATVALPPDA